MRESKLIVVLAAVLIGGMALAETPEKAEPGKSPPLTATTPKPPAPGDADLSKPAPPPPKTLYTRLGGANRIAVIADDLIESLYKNTALANAQIRQGLADIPKPAMRYHLTTLLCQLFRGPEVYTGQAIHEIYAGLRLTEADWKALQTELEGAADRAKIGDEDKKEVIAAFNDLKKQLAEVVTRIFNEKGVFAVMPLGWERQKVADPGTLISVLGPVPEKGAVRSSVQILMEEFKPGLEMNAKEFLRANQYYMAKAEPSMKDVKTQSMQLNGEPIEAFACTLTTDAKAEISMESFYFVKNKRGYTIQFKGAKDTFESNKAAFSDVLRSLKIE